VLDAIRLTPRAAFVPAAYADTANDDGPVPIPRHQVTTQPSLCAAMTAALRLDGTQQALEVGTGYGYQTALLARLAARVVSMSSCMRKTPVGCGGSGPWRGRASSVSMAGLVSRGRQAWHGDHCCPLPAVRPRRGARTTGPAPMAHPAVPYAMEPMREVSQHGAFTGR
jgi:hypothetical protein